MVQDSGNPDYILDNEDEAERLTQQHDVLKDAIGSLVVGLGKPVAVR